MPINHTLLALLLCVPVSVQAALDIFACEPEWAALAQELGADAVSVYSATTARQDPHHIQARPSLIAKARRADLLVCTGAELEAGWLPLLLRKAANARIQPGQPGHFLAAEFVHRLGVPASADRRLGDIHAQGNPHVHTDPGKLLPIAAALAARMIEFDAANGDGYRQNLARFEARWRDNIEAWRERLQALQGVDIVTYHNYWLYLNNWLGVNSVAMLEPVPGVPPTSAHLAKLKRQLDTAPAAFILYADYVDQRPAEWLSSKTGIPLAALPASVDFQGGQSLDAWFESIVSILLRVAS